MFFGELNCFISNECFMNVNSPLSQLQALVDSRAYRTGYEVTAGAVEGDESTPVGNQSNSIQQSVGHRANF